MYRLARSAVKRIISSPLSPLSRSYVAPINDLNFLIKDVYKFSEHYKKNGFDPEAVNDEFIDMVLSETSKFGENVLQPLYEVGDTIGCKYVDQHTVITPPGYKEAYAQYCEAGWQSLGYPAEFGGQGMPQSLVLFHSEILATSNWTWGMYPGLSKGAINTILVHGSPAIKEKYLSRLVSGEWTGTMCLTEPQCGSDLNQVSTRAVPIGDGKYKINGTKIFISCGEHDMTNNIMHCVLARLPGAPEGTKGISLFLVPKHKVDNDGNISSEFNGANIGRIEDKMGCHGSSTCEINFEDAEGYLLGEENKGMNHMFTFINTSRLGTSIQGIAAAELSYQNALWYTKERRAFRALSGTVDADKVADPIIVHGDIRKNLLFQKAIAEGGRSMIYECAQLADVMAKALLEGDTKTHDSIDDRLGFMTPILKGFLTETGTEAASLGVQLYGGHGYIKSNKQEQVYRDVRIAAIWEGTTGIQALDLLGRKIFKRKEELKAIKTHCKILRNFAWEYMFTGATPEIKSHARSLYYKAIEWEAITYSIGYRAKKDKNVVGVVSVDYLMYSGYVTLAQHWLKMEVVANEKLKEGKGNKELYDSKIKIADYVFKNILPRTTTLRQTIWSPSSSIMALKPSQFSFDHAL